MSFKGSITQSNIILISQVSAIDSWEFHFLVEVFSYTMHVNQNNPLLIEAQFGRTQMIQEGNTILQAAQLYSCAQFLFKSKLISWELWMHTLLPKMKYLGIG